jgi:hypothetical protein
VNFGNSPASVAANLRISRSFGIGARNAGLNRASADFGPQTNVPSSNTGRPNRGAPGGGSLGPGGLSGNGGISGSSGASGGTDRKYALRLSVQALNIFNDINYGVPTGTIDSPYFNRSTSLAGGAFSTGSAARRIFVQANFSF